MNMWRHVFWSSFVVSGAMGLGRILGFIREALIAEAFGKSYTADVVVFTLTIPDALLNLLVAGALSITIMPELTKADNQQFRKLISIYHFLTGIIFIPLSLIIMIFSFYFTRIMAPGFPMPIALQASDLLKISVWSIPLIVWTGITSAALNSRSVFLSPAFGSVFFNLVVCTSLVGVLRFGLNSYSFIAFSILIGAFLRWGIQLKSLSKLTGKDEGTGPEIKISYHALLKRYAHAFIATSSLMIFPILARIFASKGGDGQLANLNYTQRLIDVPLSLVVGSFTLVLLPKVIKTDDHKKILGVGVTFIAMFSIIISIFLSFSSREIIGLLFGRGAFTEGNVFELASQLRFAAVMFPFYSVVFFLSNMLAATSLSHLSSYACVLGAFLFWSISTLDGDAITPDKIYQNLLFSYLSVGFIQVFLIFYKKSEKCLT